MSEPEATVSLQPLSIEMSQILDFFGVCARCGYPATASLVVRHYPTQVHEIVYVSCGLPCGWDKATRTVRAARSHPIPVGA